MRISYYTKSRIVIEDYHIKGESLSSIEVSFGQKQIEKYPITYVLKYKNSDFVKISGIFERRTFKPTELTTRSTNYNSFDRIEKTCEDAKKVTEDSKLVDLIQQNIDSQSIES